MHYALASPSWPSPSWPSSSSSSPSTRLARRDVSRRGAARKAAGSRLLRHARRGRRAAPPAPPSPKRHFSGGGRPRARRGVRGGVEGSDTQGLIYTLNNNFTLSYHIPLMHPFVPTPRGPEGAALEALTAFGQSLSPPRGVATGPAVSTTTPPSTARRTRTRRRPCNGHCPLHPRTAGGDAVGAGVFGDGVAATVPSTRATPSSPPARGARGVMENASSY
eukprot:scaffold5988_cov381-Prasinococcus_capsulatus_cf.AAC.16